MKLLTRLLASLCLVILTSPAAGAGDAASGAKESDCQFVAEDSACGTGKCESCARCDAEDCGTEKCDGGGCKDCSSKKSDSKCGCPEAKCEKCAAAAAEGKEEGTEACACKHGGSDCAEKKPADCACQDCANGD